MELFWCVHIPGSGNEDALVEIRRVKEEERKEGKGCAGFQAPGSLCQVL